MRLASALALALFTSAMGAGSASAATSFGSDLSSSRTQTFGCNVSGGCDYSQAALPGRTFASPINGVITRWRVKDSNGPLTFRVYRPDTSGNSTGVGSSRQVTVTFAGTAVPEVFPAQIPVRAGDRIGALLPAGFVTDLGVRQPTGAVVDTFAGGLPDGTTAHWSSEENDFEMLINADVEPDVDGDGFGDETQDACPSAANTSGPCPDIAAELTASPTSVVRTGNIAYTLTVRNNSTAAGATGVDAHVAFPANLDVDVQHLPAGCSAGSATGHEQVDCRMPDIGAGAAATVAIRAQTLTIGASTVGAAVSYDAVDPNTANNTAAVTTTGTFDSVHRCPGANFSGGTAAADRLVGSAFSDPIYGDKGADALFGLGGADCIFGGPGNDRIVAGPGNDLVNAGPGNDRINGGGGRDRMFGGAGNDTIDASDRAHDTVDCGPGRDKVTARRGDKLRRCERIKRLR